MYIYTFTLKTIFWADKAAICIYIFKHFPGRREGQPTPLITFGDAPVDLRDIFTFVYEGHRVKVKVTGAKKIAKFIIPAM